MKQKMTVSFSKGKATETSIRHNNRSLDLDHFDFDKAGHRHILREFTPLNEVLVHRDIKAVYQEQFGAAVEAYNAKQKRKDRRINDYYRKVKSSKNQQTQREFVVQVGSQKDYLAQDRATSPNWQAAKDILEKFEHDFAQDNPNLVVYNAVIHLDEPGSPHLHLNVVPVAHLKGAKRGLTAKPSFDQALAEEGYQGDSKDSRAIFRAFQHHEAERLTAIAAQFGIEREPGLTNQLKNVHEYKQAMRAVEQVQKQAQLQKSKNAEVDVTLTDKEVLVQQLEQQINAKRQNLANLDHQQALSNKNEQIYLNELRRLTEPNKGQNSDFYLPTNFMGIVDKNLAQQRLAKLIKQAQLPQSFVQIIQTNKKLLAANAQLQAQNQKLTAANKASTEQGYWNGYKDGVARGRFQEKQRVHENAGQPYQDEIQKLKQEIASDNKLFTKLRADNSSQDLKNYQLTNQVDKLQAQLAAGKQPYEQKIAQLTTELQDERARKHIKSTIIKEQRQKLAENEKTAAADQQTIKQQQQQIQKLEKFAKTIITAIHKCKPLLKDTWNQVIERIGQHFRQDQHPDFDPFKQEWPQKDYQQLTTPSQTELRQRYLEQQSGLEDDWELER